MVENIQNKVCSKCALIKGIDEFSPDRYKKTGLSSWCKICQNIHASNKYKTDVEYRERVRAARRTPEALEKARQYQQTDRARAIRRATARKPGVRYSQFLSYAKRNNFDVAIDKDQFKDLISRPCTYCGSDISGTGCGLDRIDNTKDYVIDNVLPCCTVCNSVRNRFFSVEEMKKIGLTIQSVLNNRQDK